jgi:cyclic pyranopterin phosphate synthase
VSRVHPLVEDEPDPTAVARRYRFADGIGDLGVITSVSRPFCGDCTRARLGVDGKLYTCLFATAGIDLREPLRSGAGDEELGRIVAERWRRRDDRYSELRGLGVASGERIEMSYIGG